MAFEPKDAIAIIGVAASIGIGVRNWIVTTSIRAGTIKIEEFRSQIRDPIQKKLDKLNEVREALTALQRPNGLDDTQLRAQIADQLATFEFTIQDLADLFDHADRSSFAHGKNWRSRYVPKLEEAGTRLGRITADGSFDRIAAGGALSEAIRAISDITGELRLRFEHEISELVPSGLLGLKLRIGRAK